MKLQIHPTLIFRTPKFSYNATLTDCWVDLKEAIKISSTAFYDHIKDIEVDDLDKLSPKIQFTIWKYFNRAKYRSTPYGTFASFSLLKNTDNGAKNIIVPANQNAHEFVDWPIKNDLEFPFETLIKDNSKLFSNSSFYISANSIRYIACTDGQFELAEIDYDDFVFKILNACLTPISLSNLIQRLQLIADEIEPLYSLLADMLSLQLLFSDKSPNIMGEDYFNRIQYPVTPDTPKYIIAERKPIEGNFDFSLLAALPNLIHTLQKVVPAQEQLALKQFITRFVKKFEQREVSLVVALDPEMGIGYDELEQAGLGDDFVVGLKSKPKEDLKNHVYDQFKKDLRSSFLPENFEKNKPVFLDKLALLPSDKIQVLPNSFNMIMSVVDDLVCLEQLGGITANALSGRFTLPSNEVFNYAQSIAEIEKSANPEVLFFDVAYMIEAHVDNINRRKLIYDHQLSILNFDTSERPLTLDDIMLSVQADQVILRSKKYNKRLVPRMASAYNYARSDLSVFRLFCDLQHQGVKTSLAFSLENIFPDLNYYPRFQYKNIIISLAKWRLNSKDFLNALGKFPDVVSCRGFLLNLGITEYFKTGKSDQTLTFNIQNDIDMLSFIDYMRKQEIVILEEVILPTSSLVKDELDNSYLAQFILAITHQEEIYKGYSLPVNQVGQQIRQFFPPGSEWLYFEIYCHQQRSDYLLLTAIEDFLSQFQAEIKQWFFIRYNENGDHIRFRILLNDVNNGQKLTSALSDNLNSSLNSGIVSDFMIKTYKRETERYGNDLIEDVEKHFCKDSKYNLSILSAFPSAFEKYKLCSQLVFSIQNENVFSLTSFKHLIQLLSNAYNKEHQLETADFKKLNIQYQLYRAEEVPVLNEEQQNLFNILSKSFVEILTKCSPERKGKLFGDLMHMHVNRLFNKDQRTHEMVMYYYLLKDIQRKMALDK